MPLFDYDRVYQAYSGCDMVAHINHIPVGTMQALTVSISRETVPIYVMGDRNPKTFVRGKRGIAGTLSFSTFDRHALLYDVFREGKTPEDGSWYQKSLTDIMNATDGYFYTDTAGNLTPGQMNFTTTTPDSARYGRAAEDIQDVIDTWSNRKLRYADELPPFNITLTMINDWGAASTCNINGVVVLNEGTGYTMDDLTSEIAFTYAAREVTPLSSLSTGMFK